MVWRLGSLRISPARLSQLIFLREGNSTIENFLLFVVVFFLFEFAKELWMCKIIFNFIHNFITIQFQTAAWTLGMGEIFGTPEFLDDFQARFCEGSLSISAMEPLCDIGITNTIGEREYYNAVRIFIIEIISC